MQEYLTVKIPNHKTPENSGALRRIALCSVISKIFSSTSDINQESRKMLPNR